MKPLCAANERAGSLSSALAPLKYWPIKRLAESRLVEEATAGGQQ